MGEVKHTNLPWRVEEDTDLIWGACNDEDQSNYGMGYPIASGFSSFGTWAKGRPDFPEKEANAEFIVRAANAHYDLLEALKRFVSEYIDLVESGDAVFWDAEKEEKVKMARAAIAKAEGK